MKLGCKEKHARLVNAGASNKSSMSRYYGLEVFSRTCNTSDAGCIDAYRQRGVTHRKNDEKYFIASKTILHETDFSVSNRVLTSYKQLKSRKLRRHGNIGYSKDKPLLVYRGITF